MESRAIWHNLKVNLKKKNFYKASMKTEKTFTQNFFLLLYSKKFLSFSIRYNLVYLPAPKIFPHVCFNKNKFFRLKQLYYQKKLRFFYFLEISMSSGSMLTLFVYFFRKEELKKERKIVQSSCYNWCNWQFNYIPKPLRKQQVNILNQPKLLVVEKNN